MNSKSHLHLRAARSQVSEVRRRMPAAATAASGRRSWPNVIGSASRTTANQRITLSRPTPAARD